MRSDNGGKSGGRLSAMFCLQRSEGSEVRRAVIWADASGARTAVMKSEAVGWRGVVWCEQQTRAVC